MENREQIVKELFELRVYLNRSNKKQNEKTEIKMDVRISRSKNMMVDFICRLKDANSSSTITLSNNA